jgi:hypothetical protein
MRKVPLGGDEGLGNSVTMTLVAFEFDAAAHDAQDAESVCICGDFTDWMPRELDRSTGDVWMVEVPLRPGSYEFRYLVDGERWLNDPTSDSEVDNPYGSSNSIVHVDDHTSDDHTSDVHTSDDVSGGEEAGVIEAEHADLDSKVDPAATGPAASSA